MEFGYDHFIAKPNVILPKKIDTIVGMILDTLALRWRGSYARRD